ncbi:DUF7024 domain-containing protein [Candidatus Contendibacter odensensis]|uniref:Carbohydrate translocase n=1 Tax=Candidatus Contendobacter odensis Run_B_J11 TaxID=1400861 RepID=A0A7U7GBX8_9GAMM|nr:hypothetical protein [Candidatus Contendobacter odensis]CDH45578.1 putative carbohydrate translocase [Candidatus Contendobacter odensis Run_B_J11]
MPLALPDKAVWRALLVVTVLSLTLCYSLHLWQVDLTLPLRYSGDGLMFSAIIKNTLETGFYLHNPHLGAPFGAEYYDFPMVDGVSFLLIRFFGLFTTNFAAVYTLCYLAGFLLAGSAAFLILRRMHIGFLLALTGAVLYACLPFYFLRIEHLFLVTSYFIAPIMLWAALRILSNQPPFFNAAGKFRPLNPRWLIAALLAGTSGAYFAFFGVMLTALAALLNFITTKSWRGAVSGALFIGLLGSSALLTLAPNLDYHREHGPNQQVAQRAPVESEAFGLRITQLLLPHPGHRSDTLRAMVEKYSRNAPLVTENATAALGSIGAAGFLLLILVLLSGQRLSHNIPYLWELSVLNISMVLYGTIGGFATVFALLVHPQIRSVNRISIFIGFAALAAVLLLIQALQNRRQGRAPHLGSAMAVLLLGFGLWDQLSPYWESDQIPIAAEFAQDADFIHAIEDRAGADALIYQLPYTAYPETPVHYQEGPYALLRGYLHSDHLRWSYGGIWGRPEAMLLRRLGALPPDQQLDLLIQAGFRGIYIERRAFPDHGQALEQPLRDRLPDPPLLSQNGHLAFYPLPVATSSATPETPEATATRAQAVLRAALTPTLPPDTLQFNRVPWPAFIAEVDGLSDAEPWGRWSNSATVTIRFNQPLPDAFMLKLQAGAFGPNLSQPFTVSAGPDRQELAITTPQAMGEMAEYVLCFTRSQGTRTLEITVPQPQGTVDDPRKLGIALSRLQILPVSEPCPK